MSQVGNVDQVLLLLREQLERANRGRGTAAKPKATRAQEATARPLDRVRALAALDTLDEDELRRAVVRGLLAEQFGDGVSNDAAMVRIAEEVSRIIGETPEGRELLQRAMNQLRNARG